MIKMKVYQIKIELAGSDPLIWRRVIMPAGATFNRLHDVIQAVTNFQDYHLLAFDLLKDNISVTNDDEAYQEHQYYKKTRKKSKGKWKSVQLRFENFQKLGLENWKKVFRRRLVIKIVRYLEAYGELIDYYNY